jgi:hypothetical protein
MRSYLKGKWQLRADVLMDPSGGPLSTL